MATEPSSSLPPDLFDQTTIISLLSTLAIVFVAYAASLRFLPSSSSGVLRFLFIWHLADALCHFLLEGSFLYHCFFSHQPLVDDVKTDLFPTPPGFLGYSDRVYGAQSGGDNPFAQLWMVYARADKRWAGVDLGVDPKVSIWMIVLATCELYGGFMTFCPEWLIGSANLDTSNFMYLWVYLFFFNTLWVWIPLWIIWYSVKDISNALNLRQGKKIL
ncbi:C-8 7 sterol isomerase emopamil-binding protein [Fusarium pseudocircinatum]|uniref:C-8 7 sterol isomerase emopamil-binding protein n=1 Tax=Fusarium pseudocircinatum TaxID=56676 RepID=A0A8H5PTA0_9HYPO|nr:C-8 7 sterol isomerase emopamil-binding protein [Fusarium pseudocircinatum]